MRPDAGCPDPAFADRIIRWQRAEGRHGLPWQGTRDAYRVWLSEIMLQQTQVATVIPYYERFLQRFPDLASLAAASETQVLELWAGLGYYARGRNLRLAARWVMDRHGGKFPSRPEAIAALPGIGRSTAAAIAVFAFGARAAILDGNVKRVLARAFAVPGFPGKAAVQTQLWDLAQQHLPLEHVSTYTQGLMDLGSTLCTRTRPQCSRCPLADVCLALAQGEVHRYPGTRPPRTVPRREARFLVALRGDEVLLERRPSTGIWGGLWCFPELPMEDWEPAAVGRYALELSSRRDLEPIEHAFTHFRLTLHPVVVVVAAAPGKRVAEPGQLWLELAQAGGAAVPTPVRRLLARLERTQGAQ